MGSFQYTFQEFVHKSLGNSPVTSCSLTAGSILGWHLHIQQMQEGQLCPSLERGVQVCPSLETGPHLPFTRVGTAFSFPGEGSMFALPWREVHVCPSLEREVHVCPSLERGVQWPVH